jgi:hypothetical protein
MDFRIVPYSGSRNLPGADQCFLISDNWDDFSYKTTFQLVYFDNNGERQLGLEELESSASEDEVAAESAVTPHASPPIRGAFGAFPIGRSAFAVPLVYLEARSAGRVSIVPSRHTRSRYQAAAWMAAGVPRRLA